MSQRRHKRGAIIVVVGASGVGKSYLVKQLGRVLKIPYFLESPVSNLPQSLRRGFLTQDHQKLIFIHLWYRNKQVTNTLQAAQWKSEGNAVVLDTCLIMNQMYAQLYLKGTHRSIIQKLLELDAKLLPKPDAIIFLKASQSHREKRRAKRGRDYEKTPKNQRGAVKMEKLLNRTLAKEKNVLVIERAAYDFHHSGDVQRVIKQLAACIPMADL